MSGVTRGHCVREFLKEQNYANAISNDRTNLLYLGGLYILQVKLYCFELILCAIVFVHRNLFLEKVEPMDEEYDENGFLVNDEEKIRALMLRIRPLIFEGGKCEPEIVIPAMLRILGYIVGMGEVGGDLKDIYNQMIKDIEHSRKVSEVAAESFKLFDRLRTGSGKDGNYET